MLIFFAGAEGELFRNILAEAGAQNVLQSFYSLGAGKEMRVPGVERFKNYLLDSGGFSARQHGVTISVEKYAQFLNQAKIKYAFNLDVLDLKTSLENQHYLDTHTNTYIMPVFHGNEWIDENTRDLLDYYIECYPYIALGGMAGKENSRANLERFLNYVFNRTKSQTMVHGLGMTSKTFLKAYPFFSVDSTSWLTVNRYGNSAVYTGAIGKVRLSTRHWSERLVPEIRHWIKTQDEISRLWDMRGIKWGELNYNELMKKRKLMTYEEWKEKNGL